MIAYDLISNAPDADIRIVWAHGWGHSGKDMQPLTSSFSNTVENVLLDFPGFGKSPAPAEPWGTAEYADATAELLASMRPVKRTFWVGHSFGCRIGIQLAARHPKIIDGMSLIAAAGLQRKRPIVEQLTYLAKIYSYKSAKAFYKMFGRDVSQLAGKFGSADYRAAGEMRQVLSKVVREDLTDVAQQVPCPVTLIYGRNDRDTPIEIGERLEKLIPNAKMLILDHQDHFSVLGDGRYPVIKAISEQVEKLK